MCDKKDGYDTPLPHKNQLHKLLARMPWDHIGRASLIFGIPLLLLLVLLSNTSYLQKKPDLQLIARIEDHYIARIEDHYTEEHLTLCDLVANLLHLKSNDVDVSDSPVTQEDEPDSLVTQEDEPDSLDTEVKTVSCTVWVCTRVLVDGSPEDSVQVWAIAHDASGNSFSPPATLTSEDGYADLGPIPVNIGPDDSRDISLIHVKARYSVAGQTIMKSVPLHLNMDKIPTKPITISAKQCSLVGLIFLASVLVALVRARWPWLLQAEYIISVVLTLLLSGAVILLFLEGATIVHLAEQETGATSVSMGFVHIVKGSYFPDQNPNEWIVTITPSEGRTMGFGAPLWVILVSVIGAVLIAIKFIIEGLTSQSRKKTMLHNITGTELEAKIENKVAYLVLYQLFILFAPIGAIFLYQMLLLTGAADENLTVGIAALAAGAGLNLLLKKAINTQASIISWNGSKKTKKVELPGDLT